MSSPIRSPLLALLFKLARAALPDKFQYFGFGCSPATSCRQSLHGSCPASRRAWSCRGWSITALFVLSPLLPDRAIGHYALMAHWLVLAALYLYLRAPDAPRDGVVVRC